MFNWRLVLSINEYFRHLDVFIHTLLLMVPMVVVMVSLLLKMLNVVLGSIVVLVDFLVVEVVETSGIWVKL